MEVESNFFRTITVNTGSGKNQSQMLSIGRKNDEEYMSALSQSVSPQTGFLVTKEKQ